MNIYVDADACPVKDIIVEVSKEYKILVYLVCSISHYSTALEGVEKIYVDNTPQAADLAIVNRVQKGDVVITQDYGLAAMVLGKECVALHHTGRLYTNKNIDKLLFKRHISSKVRRGGGKTKGPRALTNDDKERFRQALIKVLTNSDIYD